MSKLGWTCAIASLLLLSLLQSGDSVSGDAPDDTWRQEQPKFAVTQQYCLYYTGNAMIQSAARKAFNAIDAHFGGILNPVQFQEACTNFPLVYWVDENSGDCVRTPPAIACALIWNYTNDGVHFHGNGGHIGVNVSYWIWDNQPVMDSAVAQELLHLWGLNHVECDHPHPSAMSQPAIGYVDGSGRYHVTSDCTGATGATTEDLNSLDPLYSTSNVPLVAHLEPNSWNPHDGTFYWNPDLIHEEAWFSIERKAGTGSWSSVTPWAAANSRSFANLNSTLLPVRLTGTATSQDCWRMLAWSNLWASNYSSVSCASRPGTSFPVDGVLVQYVGSGTSEIVGHNLSGETVTVKLYDGLLGLGGSTTPLQTCYNRAQGQQCNYSYVGRGTGGWHSIEMIRPNGESWAWAVSVASDSQGQPPGLPTPAPTPTPPAKDPNGDTDGDGIPNSSDSDDDNDGCPDVKELQTVAGSEMTGGRRDPHNRWDYFNPTNDGTIRVDDILAVVGRYFSSGNPTGPLNTIPPAPPAYHPKFDRAPLGPNIWNLTQGSGQVLVPDILAVIAQYFHDCGTGIVKVP